MEELISLLLNIAQLFGGYVGIFVISIIGNLIPFMPIPYLVAVYLYSAYIPGSNPLTVGVVSGVGGGLGKLFVYYMSRGASRLIRGERKARLDRLRQIIGNYGAIAVFIFAATPSPDDVVIALLGLMKYSVTKFFIAVTAGKILISVLTAYTGKIVVETLGYQRFLESIVVSVIIFVVAMLVITLIDWDHIIEVVGTRGIDGLLEEIKERGVRRTLFGK